LFVPQWEYTDVRKQFEMKVENMDPSEISTFIEFLVWCFESLHRFIGLLLLFFLASLLFSVGLSEGFGKFCLVRITKSQDTNNYQWNKDE